MQQGSSASALAARTAGMTDEQILDLDLEQIAAESAALPPAPQDDLELLGSPATSLTAGTSFSPQGAVMATAPAGLDNTNKLTRDPLAVTSRVPLAPGASAEGKPFAKAAQGEPASLQQLETQPAAAGEAGHWRQAAQAGAA